jgi:hypothetical protein
MLNERLQNLTWQVSRERVRYEWMRQRSKIVSARIRICVVGHVALALFWALIQSFGGLSQFPNFTTVGWVSLLLTSGALFALEILHVLSLPRTPPRFVVRPTGLTEYTDDGPRIHWDWQRARTLSIETDSLRPNYRSLVLDMPESRWCKTIARVYVPLPEPGADDAFVDERCVVAAIADALEFNGIEWEPGANGELALQRREA